MHPPNNEDKILIILGTIIVAIFLSGIILYIK